MLYKLWDCLASESKACLFFHQRKNHDKRWTPPGSDFSRNVSVKYAMEPTDQVPAVMQATPADVLHNRGVFTEKAV